MSSTLRTEVLKIFYSPPSKRVSSNCRRLLLGVLRDKSIALSLKRDSQVVWLEFFLWSGSKEKFGKGSIIPENTGPLKERELYSSVKMFSKSVAVLKVGRVGRSRSDHWKNLLNALNLNKTHQLSHKKGGSLNQNSSCSEYHKLCHPQGSFL